MTSKLKFDTKETYIFTKIVLERSDTLSNEKLDFIRRFCDTKGVHLSNQEKDILYKILKDPQKYNGYISRLFSERNSGKDYRGRWETITEWQYKIVIDTALTFYERFRHQCDDGYDQSEHWDWENATKITDMKKIREILKNIKLE